MCGGGSLCAVVMKGIQQSHCFQNIEHSSAWQYEKGHTSPLRNVPFSLIKPCKNTKEVKSRESSPGSVLVSQRSCNDSQGIGFEVCPVMNLDLL